MSVKDRTLELGSDALDGVEVLAPNSRAEPVRCIIWKFE